MKPPIERPVLVDILVDLEYLSKVSGEHGRYLIRRIRRNLVKLLPRGKLNKIEGTRFFRRLNSV